MINVDVDPVFKRSLIFKFPLLCPQIKFLGGMPPWWVLCGLVHVSVALWPSPHRGMDNGELSCPFLEINE